MPLREHCRRPPPSNHRWSTLHLTGPRSSSPTSMRRLPDRYIAQPRVYLGLGFEIDVAAYEHDRADLSEAGAAEGGVAVATAVQAPPQPTLTVATDMPDVDDFEVLIYDMEEGESPRGGHRARQPGQQGSAESRRAFVAKCGSMLLPG